MGYADTKFATALCEWAGLNPSEITSLKVTLIVNVGQPICGEVLYTPATVRVNEKVAQGLWMLALVRTLESEGTEVVVELPEGRWKRTAGGFAKMPEEEAEHGPDS